MVRPFQGKEARYQDRRDSHRPVTLAVRFRRPIPGRLSSDERLRRYSNRSGGVTHTSLICRRWRIRITTMRGREHKPRKAVAGLTAL